MKKLLFVIFLICISCALYLYGKDGFNIVPICSVKFDSLNSTYYVTNYETAPNVPPASFYSLPYVDFIKDQTLHDSIKWFSSMMDIYDALDSLSHERKSEMYEWTFLHKDQYDHFVISDWSFELLKSHKDKMYGGFILNGVVFIIFLEDSLKYRKEIENMFLKRSDSITVYLDYEYVPNSLWHYWDVSTDVVGVYQDSLLIPYLYTRENKRTYYLNDSIAKYLPD